MRAFPHTNVLVYLFDADNPTRATRRQPCWPAGRKTWTARRKRPTLKRHPGHVVILCAARDTIHGHAPSPFNIQHNC